MVNVLRVTKADLDENNYYKNESLVNDEGSIEVAANLGWVKVRNFVRCNSGLFIEAGSFIEAGESIEAGEFIKAGSFIKARESIISGLLGTRLGDIIAKSLSVKLRICAGFNCKETKKIIGEIKSGKVILGKVVKL